MTVEDAMKQAGVRVRRLEWSGNFPPNFECSYDHCCSNGGAWQYQIEWKSWKDFDTFCVQRNIEFLEGRNTLEAAKAAAQADYESRIIAALELGEGE